jgi:hypothetical protein
MSDIPYAREIIDRVHARLFYMGEQELADDLAEALQCMVREPPKRRAQVKSDPVTAKTRDAIKHYALAYPNRHITEIASHFCVNPGRVSEIINGKKDHL